MEEKFTGILDKYPYEILDNKVGGLELRICGIAYHEGPFQRHKELYDELISNSICVVNQYSPDKSDAAGNNPLISETQPWKVTDGIKNLCEKHKKKMFKVDPLNVTGFLIDNTVFVSSLTGVVSMAWSGEIRKKLSRRQFLMVMGGLSYILLSTHFFIDLPVYFEKMSDKFLRVPTYGYNDFRNVKIAKGLEIIPELLEDDKGNYILAFHSWTHPKAIDYYLTHKTVREAKDFLYSATYNLVGDSFVKEYDLKNGSWKETKRMPY